MKILVCISHVPDTTSKINFTDNDTKFDTNGVQFVINPYDEFVLTRAMWFKEKQGATVTVVNVGTAVTEPTLRKALAIGADDAIRINAVPNDGMSVAKEIAAVAKNGGYDVVLAENRLIQMGEKKSSIKVIGSPDLDIMFSKNLPSIEEVKKYYEILYKNYGIVMVENKISNSYDEFKNS